MENIIYSKNDNRIRILHIVQSAGGVERYLRSFLKYINSEKYCNILVCSNDYQEERYVDLVDYFENVDMIREINIKSDISAILKVRKFIKKYKPNIVYCHSSKAGAIGRMANIGFYNRCIYNPHGWAFNMCGSNIKKGIYICIEKMLGLLTDKIVCISEAEQVSALKYKICRENKLIVINNGIDFEEYNAECNDISRVLLDIPEDAFIVGCVGRLSEQKAPDVFAKAAVLIKEEIPNAYFLMVGDGELKTSIEEIFKKNNIRDYKITGWVDNPMSYIKLFDIATLLSRWEGFGLVLAEYMLAGKTIVATNVDAIPYVVIDEENGLLVNVDNEVAVHDAVMRIYNDEMLNARLKENGYNIVYQKYSAKKMVKHYEQLFIRIVTQD